VHEAAVTAVLRYWERHASLSRRGRGGVEQIASAGFAAALFDHRNFGAVARRWAAAGVRLLRPARWTRPRLGHQIPGGGM